MTYHKHGVTLSSHQVRKLGRGEPVRLKHEHLRGPHSLYLTEKQVRHLAKSHQSGKGAQIHMTHEQLKYHHTHGGSIFDTLKRFGSKFVEHALPIAREIATPVVKHAKDRLVKAASKKLTEMVDGPLKRVGAGRKRRTEGKGALSDVLAAFGMGLNGAGRKKKHHRHHHKKKEGGSLFGDILGSVGSIVQPIAQQALPILTQAATQALAARMTGAGTKRRKKKVTARSLDDGMGLFA